MSDHTPGNDSTTRYNAEIVAGDLLPRETQIVAELWARGLSTKEISQRIRAENLLQKRTAATGVREGRLILNRLSFADPELISLILDTNRQIGIQASLVLAIEHNRLIGDFLQRVIRERWRVFETKLRPSDWEDFLDVCEQFNPEIRDWKPVTRAKVGQVVKRILVQAGYLEGKRDHRIIPAVLTPEIRRYLTKHEKDYILDCMVLTL